MKKQINQGFATGQSIVEVLIAFGVIVVLGIALISAGLLTQRTSISARNSTQATKLAQGYLEQVRVIRDLMGFASFNSVYNSNDTCYAVLNSDLSDPAQWSLTAGGLSGTQLGACNSGTAPYVGEQVKFNNVTFYRKVTLKAGTSGVTRPVQVDVVWLEGTNDRSITTNTLLAKWCEGKIDGTGALCP